MSVLRFRPSRAAVWLGASTCLLLAAPAFAQQGAPAMRYLSWVGKPETAQTQIQAAPRVQPVSNGVYPSIGSLGGRPTRYSPSVASGALTPASAWYTPQPTGPSLPPPPYAQQQAQPQTHAPQPYAAPSYAPQVQTPVSVPPVALSNASAYVQPAYGAQPMPGPHYQEQQRQLQQSQTAPGPAWAQPGYTPQVYATPAPQPAPAQFQAPPPFPSQGQPQGAPLQQQAYTPSTVTGPGWASPQPVSSGAPVADPMAPRRDAPIFSIAGAQQPQQQVQPQASGEPLAQQTTTSGTAPSRDGARYYSVHRAAGHQPDPTPIPESVYAVIPEGAFLDARSNDLAEPPPPPIQTRTINGRVQAINQGDNPSLP